MHEEKGVSDVAHMGIFVVFLSDIHSHCFYPIYFYFLQLLHPESGTF